ncbi:MAG: T9SS type A sorting domain-containing protein [Saprospiraceae bacterium]|nr:T9SS type A sorting domain-containing protein [Saprospiraceae bacterium]
MKNKANAYNQIMLNNQPSGGGSDAFILEFDSSNDLPIGISPNPTAGQVKLRIPEANGPLNISISDAAGKMVYQSTATIGLDNTLSLDLSFLQPGLYFAQIIGKDKLYTAKIILH